MNIFYSDHAIKRMKQRGIEYWEVERILQFPAQIRNSPKKTKEAFGITKKRRLKIIFEEKKLKGDNYIRVVSVQFS